MVVKIQRDQGSVITPLPCLADIWSLVVVVACHLPRLQHHERQNKQKESISLV